MEIFSFLALIILSLAGYSAGAVSRIGRFGDLRPNIFDVILVIIIWGGAVFSSLSLDLNRWYLVGIWVVLSALVGWLTSLFKAIPGRKTLEGEELEEAAANIFNKFWLSWKNFSKKVGGFQTRIILSLFFFIFISPFALAFKIFSDPLNIKHEDRRSYWISKGEIPDNLEKYKRQF